MKRFTNNILLLLAINLSFSACQNIDRTYINPILGSTVTPQSYPSNKK